VAAHGQPGLSLRAVPVPELGRDEETVPLVEQRNEVLMPETEMTSSTVARRRHGPPAPSAARRLPRSRRWAAAVAALIDLQDEYRTWLDALPAKS